MKRILIFLTACVIGCMFGVVIYDKYYNKPQPQTTNVSKTLLKSHFSVDPVTMITSDKEQMFIIADSIMRIGEYTRVETKFYESEVELNKELNIADSCAPVTVTNVFQICKTNPQLGGIETDVYFFVHNANTESYLIIKKHDWWGGSNDIIDTNINISLADAFEKVKESNYILPNSKFVVLRSKVGPTIVNTQWIFGNDNRGMLYVDAVTGKVTDIDPTKY